MYAHGIADIIIKGEDRKAWGRKEDMAEIFVDLL